MEVYFINPKTVKCVSLHLFCCILFFYIYAFHFLFTFMMLCLSPCLVLVLILATHAFYLYSYVCHRYIVILFNSILCTFPFYLCLSVHVFLALTLNYTFCSLLSLSFSSEFLFYFCNLRSLYASSFVTLCLLFLLSLSAVGITAAYCIVHSSTIPSCAHLSTSRACVVVCLF